MKLKNLYLFVLLLIAQISFGQSGLCTGNTPFYKVNLNGQPSGTWTSSPPIVRQGDCCGSKWPDRCIEFEITLDPKAVAINFEIVTGAVPGGAMFYQIGCGPLTKVGDPICVDGPGPHTLTFCKPGSNLNTYAITSIKGPDTSPDTKTSEGCMTTLSTTGIKNIVWKDITSNDQRYDAYLSCKTGCATTNVTPTGNYPAFVDYQVCGTPDVGPCYPVDWFCDTVRVYFVPPILNSINPNPAVFCETENGILLSGIINGGQPPYTYKWTNSSGVTVGTDSTFFTNTVGNYQLEFMDALYPTCPPKFATTVVSKELKPIVEAGNNLTVCATSPSVPLNGSVQNSNLYTWSGGGTFSSGTNSLSNTYLPSAAEILAGKAVVKLTANGILVCNPVVDSLVITINPPLTATITAPAYVCFGQKANISLNVSGGTTAYNILWNTLATGLTLNNQNPGTYSVSVSDASANTCSASASVSILENPELLLNVPPLTTIICDSTADIVAIASGGNGGPYNYLWSNGQTSNTVNLLVGNYSVSATDGKSCSITKNTTIDAIDSDLSVSFPFVDKVCYQGTTTISPNVQNGFAPYTYLWSNGATTPSISAGKGTYCVTVTDNVGCKVESCISIDEDPVLSLSLIAPKFICNKAQGSISAISSGGRYPYTYLWASGESDSSITKVAGTYSVSLTDANPNQCKINASITLVEATKLTGTITSSNVSCYLGSDGSANLSASGSRPPYTYTWSNGATGSNTNGLNAGFYNVTVSDSLSCIFKDTVEITQATLLVVDAKDSVAVLCFGESNGNAKAVASGGTPNYVYNWSTSGENTADATALSAGIHTVTVSDSKGCTTQASISILQPLALTASISGKNISCKNSNNGKAAVLVSGGTYPYSYVWTGISSTDSTLSNLAPGTYSVQVKDANNCITNTSIVISEPDSLLASINNVTMVNCFKGNNGSAEVSANGGTTPYQYNWGNFGTAAITSNLSAGIYSVTVQDANNCSYTKSITITEPSEIILSKSPPAFIRCDSSASIYVSATGGTGIYTYLWGNGAISDTISVIGSGIYDVTVTDANACSKTTSVTILPINSSLNVSIAGSPDICFGSTTTLNAQITPGIPPYQYTWNNGATSDNINVSGGSYCLTVKDSAGCIVNACFEVEEHPVLSVKINSDTVCKSATGLLVAEVSGGLAPYYFNWNTGEETQKISKSDGEYSVIVNDSITCEVVDTGQVKELTELVITFPSHQDVTCFGHSDAWIKSLVSGGLPPYQLLWNYINATTNDLYNLPVGTYSLQVTDALGCVALNSISIKGTTSALEADFLSSNITCKNLKNGKGEINAWGGSAPYSYLWWETNDTTQLVSNFAVGTYNASVLDAFGCIVSSTISISEPDSLISNLQTQSNVKCFGGVTGSATSYVTGGTSPYSYNWSNQSSSPSTQNLSAGTHSLIITDANGCEISDSVVITQPSQIITTTSSAAYITCDSSSVIFVVATGGVGNFTYAWGMGATNDTVLVNGSGNYIVSVRDSNACQKTDTAFVYPINSQLEVKITGKTDVCQGDSSTLSISITPGIPPYKILWSTGDTTESIFAKNGNYCVTVTDQSLCVFTDCFQLTVHDSLKVNVNNDTVCAGESSLLLTQVSGGKPPYAFKWSSGEIDQNISKSAGTYLVNVSDALACAAQDSAKVVESPAIVLSFPSKENNPCYGDSKGKIVATLSGGISPYQITWQHSINQNLSLNNLAAGTYVLNVQDQNKCKVKDSVAITQPLLPLALNLIGTNPKCNLDCNGAISSTVIGGTSPYSYSWSNNSSNKDIQNLCAGDYVLSIKDANACTLTGDTLTLLNPNSVTITNSLKSDALCFNDCNGSISVISPNATLYSVDSGQTFTPSPIFNNLCPKNYLIIAKDNNNCSDSISNSIVNPLPILISGNKDTTICAGNPVNLNVLASGGSGDLTYNWNGSTGNSSSTVYPVQTVQYVVFASDTNACISANDTINISVSGILKVEAKSNQLICYGDSANLSATASGGDNNYQYTWSSEPNGFGSTQNKITVKPTENTQYIVSAKDNCSPIDAKDTVVITVEPPLVFTVDLDLLNACIPAEVAYNIQSDSSLTGYTYDWFLDNNQSSDLSNPFGNYQQAGNYNIGVNITSPNGCVYKFFENNYLTLFPNPIANFSVNPTQSNITDPVFVFSNESENFNRFTWDLDTNGISSELNPIERFFNPGCYPIELIVWNQNNCSDTTSKEICVEDVYRFYAPNAFTPNDDGINDVFTPKWHLMDENNYNLMIFDRWGELIYESTNPYAYWNGRRDNILQPAQIDVYVWKIDTKDIWGKSYKYIGTVSLVR